MLRRPLALLAIATLAVVGLLTLSLLVFRPPRADYAAWAFWASLFVAHSLVVLAWVSGLFRGARIQAGIGVGGAILAIAGVVWVRGTFTSPHFEGYQLVLGSLVALQGVASLFVAARASMTRLSS